MTGRERWDIVGRPAVGAVGAGLLVWLFFLVIGVDVGPVFCVAVALAAVGLYRLVGAVLALQADAEDDAPTGDADPVRPVALLSPLESRLAAGHRSADLYRRRLHPVLAAAVTDRLRLRRGIDVDTEPDRAREELGDELWQWLMTAPSPEPLRAAALNTPGPSHAELDRLVARIEAI